MRGRYATEILQITSVSNTAAFMQAAGAHLVDVKSNGQYQKRIDRIRQGLMSSMGRMWKADLNRELDDLLGEVEDFDIPVGWRSAVEARVTQHFDMTRTFERTYVTVHPLIAERVYDSLVDDSKTFGRGFEQKADPSLVDEWERAALEFIRGEGGDLITSVELVSHQYVVRHVRRLTEQAISEGWSINRLKREFRAKMISINDFRARMIARTETMRSANLGSRAAAVSTNLDLIKEWLIAPLGTGDRHATLEYSALHDQRRDLNSHYDVKGHSAMYPCDLILPPEESIQCRCSERYIPRDRADTE